MGATPCLADVEARRDASDKLRERSHAAPAEPRFRTRRDAGDGAAEFRSALVFPRGRTLPVRPNGKEPGASNPIGRFARVEGAG